jgi:hypothetical protein
MDRITVWVMNPGQAEATARVEIRRADGSPAFQGMVRPCPGGVASVELPGDVARLPGRTGYSVEVTSDRPLQTLGVVEVGPEGAHGRLVVSGVDRSELANPAQPLVVPLMSDDPAAGLLTYVVLHAALNDAAVQIETYSRSGRPSTAELGVASGQTLVLEPSQIGLGLGAHGTAVVRGQGVAVATLQLVGGFPGIDVPGDEYVGLAALPAPDLRPSLPTGGPARPANGGVGSRLLLPALGALGDTARSEAWVQVRNSSDEGVMVVFNSYSALGQCPPDERGPVDWAVSPPLPPGGSWVFTAGAGVVSGELLSIRPGTQPRTAGGNGTLVPAGSVAATVLRRARGDVEPSSLVHSAYTSEAVPPASLRPGLFAYHIPDAVADWDGRDSQIYIQNGGRACAAAELIFRSHGDCEFQDVRLVYAIPPHETAVVSASSVVGPEWRGSAEVRSQQPLAIVADVVGADQLVTSRALPAPSLGIPAVEGGAPFLRETHGWETTFAASNAGSSTARLTLDVLDGQGNPIGRSELTPCPSGSATARLVAGPNQPVPAAGGLSMTSDQPMLGWLSIGRVVAGGVRSSAGYEPMLSSSPEQARRQTLPMLSNAITATTLVAALNRASQPVRLRFQFRARSGEELSAERQLEAHASRLWAPNELGIPPGWEGSGVAWSEPPAPIAVAIVGTSAGRLDAAIAGDPLFAYTGVPEFEVGAPGQQVSAMLPVVVRGWSARRAASRSGSR